MICLLSLIVPAGLFIFESIQTGKQIIPGRVQRFSKGLDLLLLFIPLLAVPVFAVLFLFVLEGRFYERLCHAALVLALWLYSARFYWFLISFFKNKLILALSIIGMIASAAPAVYLTPLDRYVRTVHSSLGAAAILPGIILLLVFYVAAFFTARAKRDQRPPES